MDRAMIDWRLVPGSLRLFVVFMLADIILLDVTSVAPPAPLIFGSILVIAWAYFLLRRLRWLWFVAIVLYVVSIPGIVLGSAGWAGAGLTVVGLVLLLMPSTRHYFGRRY